MIVDGYVRVSTRGQMDGEGPAVQEKVIRSFCKANGHRLRTIHTEPGVSGANDLESRDALPVAMQAVRDRQTRGIVVFKLDRLARDLIVQETLIAEIRKLGGDLFSGSAAENEFLTDDEADPSRKLVRQILGAINEYDRAMTVLKLKMGRANKAARGGYAYGAPPYGSRALDKELTDDAVERRAVALIVEAREAGHSYRAIAASLDNEGLKPRRASSWSAMGVRNIARREGVTT